MLPKFISTATRQRPRSLHADVEYEGLRTLEEEGGIGRAKERPSFARYVRKECQRSSNSIRKEFRDTWTRLPGPSPLVSVSVSVRKTRIRARVESDFEVR